MQLNRQQLGSTNWGSSVNANWGKIETETQRLQSEINKIINQIATDYGVMFGGFISFGTKNGDKNPDYIYITPSADIQDTTAYKFFLEKKEDNQKPTVPINRIFRVIDDWSSANTALAAQNIYDIAWTEGNMCVYTASGFRQVFWNDYIYRPIGINASAELEWEYVKAENTNTIATTFPPNVINAVAYKIPLTQADAEGKIQIPSPWVSDSTGASVCSYWDVRFYTDVQYDAEPFLIGWHIDHNDTTYYLQLDTEALIEDDDYVIITYYKPGADTQ